MCNRYRLNAQQIEIARSMGIPEHLIIPEPEPMPPPELFPKRIGWVVRVENGERILDTMRWGVPLNGKPITNVRNLASPFWRSMLKNPANRCLVPVTDFCEWSGDKGSKQEHWFSLPSQPIFSFAGIWRPTPEGNCYAFLTCGYDGDPATHVVGAIHPKACPVVLHREDEERWLSGEVDDVCSLATPFPSQLMRVV
ncbi:SOS response-associated peptidase [Sphingosinicella rhizophila]|uniref:Abasic site processing protein n=1 Tax=Sphingosinicella rhizophila TaxID=3050082 RepID=A0ABU3Q562_9SPHN|nr:SOS response-associated peptidase family protein [Sphingosinicella sp. GR2756]MDT9598552.1 SOS response-associated peptidase family protein [Sphingosinicella sp. GR2756]